MGNRARKSTAPLTTNGTPRQEDSEAPGRPDLRDAKAQPSFGSRMRVLVRMAATEGNYEAMLDAHDLAMRLLPPGDELWSWWLSGLESLSGSKDEDLAVFVKFTREAAGIEPWGSVPVGPRERLRALGS